MMLVFVHWFKTIFRSTEMWAVVDRVVGPRAVLELEDGEIIEIASKFLPNGALAGSVIRITMVLDLEKQKELHRRWEQLRGIGEGSK
jgi:hypothetical protein